jgi:uncharacterized short protein YbdD (DUF466 family)
MFILFDSGASKTIVSGNYVKSCTYLSSRQQTVIEPVKFRLGNGQFLVAKSMIKFEVNIQEHKFTISAVIVDTLVGVDLILGTNTLADLNGSLDFKDNRFRIKSKKVTFAPVKKVVIQPGETKQVTLQGKTPPYVRNTNVVINANRHLSKYSPDAMLVTIHKGRTQIVVTNTGDKPVYLTKGRPIASLDLGNLVTTTQSLPVNNILMLVRDDVKKGSSKPLQTKARNLVQHPHLQPNDPLTNMTEEEVIKQQIDLSNSILTVEEQAHVRQILQENRQAFSLYGELSSCPNFEANIELSNEDPFFIRPYFATESDKKIIEQELSKLVKLGILGIGHQAYTSPVMLIAKKGTTEKRVVTDFRHLNSRIRRINHPFPLLAETIKRIGNANTQVLSVIDLKSAFHCIPLSKDAQKYTGIASYHGGKHYYYKRLPQGLNISPGIFQAQIDDILSTIPNSRDFCIAHHDDIILFSPDKATHKQHLISVLRAITENGLKVSPKKCKLFRNDVTYMGHRVTVNQQGQPCIQPMHDKCSAITNLPRPKTPKQVRRLVGAVNYVASFFPNIQAVLRPLHQLTRKRNKFQWTSEHDEALTKVKELMTHPPVLHMPQKCGRFALYSDTSRTATGAYLTQNIQGHERIIGYYSKVLPNACQRYSVTELELFGLLINVSAFRHLLKGCEFDAFVDHSAIVQILKSKEQPCTNRLQKLILKLSDYSFKIGYKKGSELVLADFLSRAPREDDSEIDRVVPVAFTLFSEQDLKEQESLAPIVQPIERKVTRAYAKKMGILVPDIYPKANNTTCKSHTEHTSCKDAESNDSSNEPTEPKPKRVASHTTPISEFDIPYGQDAINPSPMRPNQPIFRQGPNPRTVAEPRLVDKTQGNESFSDHNYRDVPPELYIPPKPLMTKVNNVIANHIPKQKELDRMMDVIKRKIIRDYNLPVEIKQLKSEQETSPFYKSTYDYLAYDILPSDRKAAKTVRIKAEQYIMCDGILFRMLLDDKGDDLTLQLAIPESLAETVISQYHDNLLSNHQGAVRTYLTMRRTFYMPNMFERISNYVKACLRCQQFRNKPDKMRQFHARVPDSYRPFDRISLDFKSMPTSSTGFKHLMVICDEITRYVVCVPLKAIDAETVCEALIQKVICVFGPPSCLITDAAASLTGKLLTLLCDTLNIDKKVISVENHGSLHVERHIRTLSNFLKVNLNQLGNDWVRYVSTTCYAYNSFSSPTLGNYSPYELVFGRTPPSLTNLTFNPMSGLSQTYEEYVDHLKKKFQNISRTMLSLQRKIQDRQNAQISQKLSKSPIYTVGQLVYLYKPTSSSLTANSKKIVAEWCGPLVIHQVLDRTHYILATLKGEVLQDVFNFNRLKPCFIRASHEQKSITHVQKLKEALGQSVKQSEVAQGKPSDDTIQFIDENDETMPSFDSEEATYFGSTQPVDEHEYVLLLATNKGIAATHKLTHDELKQQFNLMMTAPVDKTMTMHRARFKSGNLQILVSFLKPQLDSAINTTVRFWWNVDRYPDFTELIEKVLSNRLIPISGTPKRMMKKLFM